MSRERYSDSGGFLGVDDEVLRSLTEGIESPLELELSVAIGVIRLTVPAICKASGGDLLPVKQFREEFVVTFEGVPLYRGQLLASGDELFFRVSNSELDRSDKESRVTEVNNSR